MNNLARRTQRLEEKLETKPGPRLIYLTPNLEGDETEETAYSVKISSEVWAYVFSSGPFTTEEVDKLREQCAEESDGVPGRA